MPKIILPLKAQILQAMKVAENSIEAATYLVQQFKKKMAFAKMTDKAKDMIERLEKYEALVIAKLTSANEPWSGEKVLTSDLQNMQANLANDAAEVLIEQGISGDLRLDIAVSDASQFIRGYSENKKPLDEKKLAHLDTLSNAWLAQENIINSNGILYKADNQGKIAEDKQGKIKADPNLVRDLMTDENKGLSAYLEQKGLPPIHIQQHKFPTTQPAAKPRPASEKPAVQAEPPEVQAPETPEPQAPGARGK